MMRRRENEVMVDGILRFHLLHFYLLPRVFLLVSLLVDYLYPREVSLFLVNLAAVTLYDIIYVHTSVHYYRKEPTPRNLSELKTRISLFSLTHYTTSLLFIVHLILNPVVWSFIPYSLYLLFVTPSFTCRLVVNRKVEGTNLELTPTVYDTLVVIFVFVVFVVSSFKFPWFVSLPFLLFGFLYLVDLTVLSGYKLSFVEGRNEKVEKVS